MIHAEVVLESDGCECLRGGLNFHTFLGLDGLMETVAVTATFHDTSGLLIDDLDLTFVNHVFHILLEEGVGFEELGDSVDTLCLDGIFLHELILAFLTLCGIFDMFCLGELRCNVGEYEELRIVSLTGKLIDTLISEFDATVFLIDDEV